MSNKEFFSKIVRGIQNFFNFTQGNSEFLISKILPLLPLLNFENFQKLPPLACARLQRLILALPNVQKTHRKHAMLGI